MSPVMCTNGSACRWRHAPHRIALCAPQQVLDMEEDGKLNLTVRLKKRALQGAYDQAIKRKKVLEAYTPLLSLQPLRPRCRDLRAVWRMLTGCMHCALPAGGRRAGKGGSDAASLRERVRARRAGAAPRDQRVLPPHAQPGRRAAPGQAAAVPHGRGACAARPWARAAAARARRPAAARRARARCQSFALFRGLLLHTLAVHATLPSQTCSQIIAGPS